MNLFKILLCVLSITLIFTACMPSENSEKETNNSSAISTSTSIEPTSEPINSETEMNNVFDISSYNPVLSLSPFLSKDKDEYEIGDFENWLFRVDPGLPISAKQPLEALEQTYDFLRETDDNHCYVVYKIKQGYIYIFFEYDVTGLWEQRFTACMEKTLSYSDFKNVKVGTPISEVEKIDPAIAAKKAVAINSLKEAEVSLKDESFIDIHILTDGVLFMRFNRETSSSEYTVENIHYFDDFIIDSSIMPDGALVPSGFGDYTINCKISEQDYPK